jgi:hypothetical protein
VCSAVCPICQVQDESMFHLFFECPRVNSRWRSLFSLLSTSDLTFRAVSLHIGLLQSATKQQQRCPTHLILIAECLWYIWRERNAFVYQGNPATAPLQQILKGTKQKLQARLWATTAINKQLRLSKDLATIDTLLLQLCPSSYPAPVSSQDTGN